MKIKLHVGSFIAAPVELTDASGGMLIELPNEPMFAQSIVVTEAPPELTKEELRTTHMLATRTLLQHCLDRINAELAKVATVSPPQPLNETPKGPLQ